MTSEIKVAVFDLNGTLYNKSSKDEFFKFICSKRRSRILKVFYMGAYVIMQKMHLIGQTEFKENFFSYLDSISPEEVERYAYEYWSKEYPAQFNVELMQRIDRLKREGVGIYCITGALELYVRPLFTMYTKVDGMAGTRVEYIDNKYIIKGDACKGEVKLEMLEEMLGTRNYHIVEAYSDSAEPILERADKGYLLKDGKITRYKWK